MSLYGRPLSAALLLAAYLAYVYLAFRRAHTHSGQQHVDAGQAAALLIYASQTGQAEAIARHSARAMQEAGHQVALCRFEALDVSALAGIQQLFFVLSTYGDGQAPEHAQRAAERLLAQRPPGLQGMRYAVLALGDRHYPNFCAFGRAVDAWLIDCGAKPAFARIEVDQLDAAQLEAWQQALLDSGWQTRLSPTYAHAVAPLAAWHLHARQLLNPGSPGAPLCSVRLLPPAGLTPHWQAGDLIEILPPTGEGPARRYSIANLPDEPALELIVRSHWRDDGSPGLVSHWLNHTAAPDAVVQLRIMNNAGFHLPAGAPTPLILIGAGSGLAGLMAHMRARAQLPAALAAPLAARNMWLIFGERSARHDRPYQQLIDHWQAQGLLSQVNLCFSREQSDTPYVQHVLRAHAAQLQEWLEHGACLMICGHAQTMAPAVDACLRDILGPAQVDALMAAGRIRRDVF